MSRKTPDWRKLVDKPIRTPPAHVDQPVSAMKRTYRIDDIIAEVVHEGVHGFRAFTFDNFMAFAARVKQVHDLNPDVLITAGFAGLFATVHGIETPKEHKARLRGRAAWLKREVTALRGARHDHFKRAGALDERLSQIQAKLSEKPKAKKKRKKK